MSLDYSSCDLALHGGKVFWNLVSAFRAEVFRDALQQFVVRARELFDCFACSWY